MLFSSERLCTEKDIKTIPALLKGSDAGTEIIGMILLGIFARLSDCSWSRVLPKEQTANHVRCYIGDDNPLN